MYSACAVALGVGRESVKSKYNTMRREGRLKENECVGCEVCNNVSSKTQIDGDGKSLSIKADNYSTQQKGNEKILAEFLEKCQVDMGKWEVSKYRIGAWDVSMKIDSGGNTPKRAETHTNYNISVDLKPRVNFMQNIIKESAKNTPQYKFRHYKPRRSGKTGIALEMAPMDAHIGKLAWLEETGYRNYDTDIAMADYKYSVTQNLNWACSHNNIEKVYYVFGNDLYHVDNMYNRTSHSGHDLDVDGRIPKIHEESWSILVRSIQLCRQVAPVEVIILPGNHDELACLYSGYALYEHFRNDKHVDVDVKDKKTRKARLWGKTLVGWTHAITGKHNTWGNELAQAFPEMWGQSVFREWHHGHLHKKQSLKTMPEFTSGGVLCRELTALSPVDRWHFKNVFTDAVPGGEAFLWSKDVGVFANYIAWTGQYEENRGNIVSQKDAIN
jgi:hypothetical protein